MIYVDKLTDFYCGNFEGIVHTHVNVQEKRKSYFKLCMRFMKFFDNVPATSIITINYYNIRFVMTFIYFIIIKEEKSF